MYHSTSLQLFLERSDIKIRSINHNMRRGGLTDKICYR